MHVMRDTDSGASEATTMRELPGFYFDEERKRYFSLSSRPASFNGSTPHPPVKKDVAQPVLSRFRTKPAPLPKHTFHDSLLKQKHSFNRLSRLETMRIITSAQVTRSHLSEIKQHPDPTIPFTSFCVHETADKGFTFALGDQQGYCFTERDDAIHHEYIMTSQVTSICSDGEITLFTSFGPRPAILIKNINHPDSLHLLIPGKLQDVRTSHLSGSSLVLGMRKQAIHFPDINAPQITNNMYVGSDVFALCREDFSVWTGARNGSVHVFDTRIDQKMEILQGRFSTSKQSTSITHIHRIREFELLISALNGRGEIHDTRFIRRTRCPEPVLTIEGRLDNNQVLHNLGLAVDPFQEYVYMAGQDCRVRIWSLRNGKQIHCPPSGFRSSLLGHEFPSPVLGMQTTRYNNRNTLWLISGSHFEQYEIP